MRKFIAVILSICACSTCLFGCHFLNLDTEDAIEAISFAEEFCLALGEDIELAKEYLASDSTSSKENLPKFIEDIEFKNDIHFSDGVSLKDRNGVEITWDSLGSSVCTYKFSCEIVVGIRVIDLSFAVIKNENGYSIIHIEQGRWVAES